MTSHKRFLIGVTGLALLALTSCGESRTAGAQSPSDFSITCTGFARPNVATSDMQRRTLKLGPQGGNRSVSVGQFRFRAQFVADEFEGKALDVFVYPKGKKDLIAQGKYQFDADDPPANQFIGGQGFTGLIYVMHPQTEAELQYFCKAG